MIILRFVRNNYLYQTLSARNYGAAQEDGEVKTQLKLMTSGLGLESEI